MKHRRLSRLLAGIPLLLLFASNADADSVRVTEPTDYWFDVAEQSTFTVRTYAVDGFWSDPMLWLYTEQGQLLQENDDWFGLQSHIERVLAAGRYRLRAGVCCGDPTRWYGGVSYDVSTNVVQVTQTVAPTTSTTVETTTTQLATTTTAESTTTSTEAPTTSVAVTTTTVEQTTTVPVIVSTTWVEPSTTTSSLTPSTFSTTTLAAAPTRTSTLSEQSTTVPVPPATTTTQPAPVVTPPTTSTTTTALPPVVYTTTSTTVPPTTTTPPDRGPVQDVVLPAVVTPENVAQIAAIVDQLTPEQITELVETLNTADADTKKQFEEEVNVFGEGFDDYVPADSKIPIGERRVLVAIGATALASSGAVRRKQ